MGTSKIGTLNEKPLHEALKRWYAQPGDIFEVPVDGFVVDIVRGDLLIEIQTRNFRRRGWVTEERRLLRVADKRILNSPADMHAFIPTTLTEPFSVSDLATATNNSRRLAGKMVYCLQTMGCVAPAGKRANAIMYARRTT